MSSSSSHALVDLARRHDVVDPQRPLEMVPDRLRRVQRAERILEDHLHLRAVVAGAAAGGACARCPCPSKMTRPLVGCVQAREQARDRALAAAALADERGDRARPQREADVVDGVHLAAVAAAPPPTGKCFVRPWTSSSVRRSSARPSLDEVAGDEMPGRDFAQRAAGSVVCRAIELESSGAAVRAARMEAAALGRRAEVGRRAGDARHAHDRPGERRERAASGRCVYGCSGAAVDRARRRLLDDLAGVHDRDAVRDLDQQREVVRDEEDGEAELALAASSPAAGSRAGRRRRARSSARP